MHCEVPSCVSACRSAHSGRPPPVRSCTTRPGAWAVATACWPARSTSRSTSGARPCRGSEVRHVRGASGPGAGHRVRHGLPDGASKFGTRAALLAEARARLAAEPNRYYDHVYGWRRWGHVGADHLRCPAGPARAADRPGQRAPRDADLAGAEKFPTSWRWPAWSWAGFTGSPSGATRSPAPRCRARRGPTPVTRRERRCSMRRLALPRLPFWRSVLVLFSSPGSTARSSASSAGSAPSTNLSDAFPWGLWVGFDILCGVALAAGGFTVSAIVYIFRLERFRPSSDPRS